MLFFVLRKKETFFCFLFENLVTKKALNIFLPYTLAVSYINKNYGGSAMITIKDIAALSGVSPTTVSNVIHGRTQKMSAETLETVRKTIKEQNYVSNMAGRLLANYGSRIIGVIMTYERRNEINAVQNPFYSEIIGALEKEIRSNGYYMMLYTSGDAEESIQMALSWNVEGLIILGCPPCDCKKLKQGLNKPIVFIDTYFDSDKDDYDNVGLQDYEGGYLMTDYLIKMGHRKIAFLADMEHPVGVDYERLRGYRDALKNAGIQSMPDDYITLPFRLEERNKKMREFCHERIHNFSAMFFASDFYAIDAVNVFFSEGISVPEMISVVGFDDNIFAVESRPKLTTVRQNISDKAYFAVKKIMDIILGGNCGEKNIRLPVKLIIRDSVLKNSEN